MYTDEFKGCVFHTRCPYATDKCKEAVPEFKEARAWHWAAWSPAGVSEVPAQWFCRRRGQAPALRDGRFRSPSETEGGIAPQARIQGELVPPGRRGFGAKRHISRRKCPRLYGPAVICWADFRALP